jgi:hypothetical protein
LLVVAVVGVRQQEILAAVEVVGSCKESSPLLLALRLL